MTTKELKKVEELDDRFMKIIKPYKDSRNYKNLCLQLINWRQNLLRFLYTNHPESKELGRAAYLYATECEPLRHEYGGYTDPNPQVESAVIYGAEWKRKQILENAIDAEVGYGKSLVIPSLGCMLDKMGLNFGDKVKLIIVKED